MTQSQTNLLGTIERTSKFPDNVFVGDWREFWFFDSDLMFEPKFMGPMRELMYLERSKEACIANLDALNERSFAETWFAVTPDVADNAYQKKLAGPGPGTGWIHRVNRFGSISDRGEWCFYCERANEIAVLAFRGGVWAQRFRSVLSRLRASPINVAVASPQSFGFKNLSAEWQNSLICAYGRESTMRDTAGHK